MAGDSTRDAAAPPLQTPSDGAAVGSATAIDDTMEQVPIRQKSSFWGAGRRSGDKGSSTSSTDRTKEIQSKIDHTTRAMEDNIRAATERGENLDQLHDRTQQVAESSKQFTKNSRTVKKNLWWKNMKLILIISSIVIFLLGAIGLVIWLQSR
jgi:hypothetical protein